MIDQSLAHPAQPSTREHRALKLYEEHHHEIVLIDTNTFEVPSQDGGRTYRVTYGAEIENCSCPDHQCRDALCVHILATALCFAKHRRPRTYSETVEAARRDAAAEYREETRRMMRAGKL